MGGCFLRSSNLGCPGEGFWNPWLPASNIYGQADPGDFAKGMGQAKRCHAGAALATGAHSALGAIYLVFFLSDVSSLLICFVGFFLSKD